MTYTIPPTSPKHASATAFGRELVRAYETRGIPRNDNYRTGSSLPKVEVAAQLAALLDWPRLREIVVTARTRACARCQRPFRNDGGNMGAKRYCSTTCRDIADNERIASRRTRQAGQTDDNRRRYQAMARLRSGIRIAESRTAELRDAIAAMCATCEPEGICRTGDCPLRGFSPLPYSRHPSRGIPRNEAQIRDDSWTPERRARQSELTMRLHAEGRIPPTSGHHPAHDPARRERWISAIRDAAAKRRKATKKAPIRS